MSLKNLELMRYIESKKGRVEDTCLTTLREWMAERELEWKAKRKKNFTKNYKWSEVLENHNRTHLKGRHKSLFFLSWVQLIEVLHPWNRPSRTISVDCFCGNRVQGLATSRDGLESGEGLPQTEKPFIVTFIDCYHINRRYETNWLIIFNSIFNNKNLFKDIMAFVCITLFQIVVSRTNGERKDVHSWKRHTDSCKLYCLKNIKNF